MGSQDQLDLLVLRVLPVRQDLMAHQDLRVSKVTKDHKDH